MAGFYSAVVAWNCSAVDTGYSLSPSIEILWLEDGDHDLKPRKTISGFTAADHLTTVADATRIWVARVLAQ